jgi:glycosyltransferase involved in cell wall biosynthesis
MKILLVYDVKGWAWHHKSVALKKYIGHEFDRFDIIPKKKFHKGMLKKYHSIHFFGWIEGKKYAKYSGVTSAVSSHNYLYKHFDRAKKLMPKYNCLTCTSKILHHELTHRGMNKNIYLCQNGVDETIFTPGKKTRDLDKFIIGWVGQPTKGTMADDAHGYQNILLPLMESLKDVKEIKFNVIAKTFKNASPHSSMPSWYRELDLFIHTGYSTGTPNPLFEAQACGIPAISTSIGAAPELLNGFNGWTVFRYYNKPDTKYCVSDFRELIFKAKDMNLADMKKNARRIIESNWTWKQRAKLWLKPLKKHGKKL